MGHSIRIALVTCFFGKLPWYFNYFALSCKFNPDIDFFIITDDKNYKKELPGNVKLVYKTIADIEQLATDKLGYAAVIGKGYKMCDFKPTYGYLFSDLLAGYHFWGYTDIDIIFGNIRCFMTEELLTEFDILSVRNDYLTGCFSLYKNIPKVNELFFESKDHKKVFTTEKHYCFDETGFAFKGFADGLPYNEIVTEVESMTHVVKRMEAQGHIKPHFDLFIIEGLPGRLKWEEGTMIFNNRFEVMFYHLIFFKNLPYRKSFGKKAPNIFAISPKKIYHKKSSLLIEPALTTLV